MADRDGMTAATVPSSAGLGPTRVELFLIGFLVLFLELACIRWFAAYVVFLQFFTNIILIACFLGMSVGCVCARKVTDWLRRLSWLSLIAVTLAHVINSVLRFHDRVAVEIGNQQASPQVVFFGTETPKIDLADVVIPVEVFAAIFFVLIALMFIGLGQELGRRFDRDPNRVLAYASNIGGSLVGIIAFAGVSFANVPSVIWFATGFAGVTYLLKRTERLTRLTLLMFGLTLAVIAVGDLPRSHKLENYWSPYYRITYQKEKREILVNGIGHQTMVPFESEERGAVYSLIHLLQRDAYQRAFSDVAIIGAGAGNDVAHTLQRGASHVDAVEIDPVIQDLGLSSHPNRPYQDSRVRKHLDDGRHFLRQTDRQYDLIVYGLVDSLILHSSFSNIRLESFLFTEQAFQDVKSALKPRGIFVTYNYFRQAWIVARIAEMLKTVFGEAPLVITLPHESELGDGVKFDHITIIIAGDTDAIASAFANNGSFWLNRNVALNGGVNGFGISPPNSLGGTPAEGWQKIAPVSLIMSPGVPDRSTDTWPFLYLKSQTVPWLYVRSVAILGTLGLLLLYWQSPGRRLAMNGRMFFLGAGFLLIETKAVVHLALIFGSTWVVNSVVFATILVMIFLSNVYVLTVNNIDLRRHFALLFMALMMSVLTPFDVFLEGGAFWKFAVPSILVMLPVFFAGVIFAVSFRESSHPDHAFGSNIAGAVVGGFSEYLSMLVGFRYILFVALGYYALAALSKRHPD